MTDATCDEKHHITHASQNWQKHALFFSQWIYQLSRRIIAPAQCLSPKDQQRRLSARRTSGTNDAAIASAASSSSAALSPGDFGHELSSDAVHRLEASGPGVQGRSINSAAWESPASQPHMQMVLECQQVLRCTRHRAIDQLSQRDHSHGLSEKFQRHQQAGDQSTSYRKGNARSCEAESLRNCMVLAFPSLHSTAQQSTALSDAE